MAPFGNPLGDFQIGADGSRVVYLADQDTSGVDELYSVPIDGSALPTKLNSPLINEGDVKVFQISDDATQVVYGASQVINHVIHEIQEVYSVPIDGSASAIRLNDTLGSNGYIRASSLKISADSSRVIYLSEYESLSGVELYSVPIDGSNTPIILNGMLVSGGGVWKCQISADSSQVVYIAVQDTAGLLELYSAPIDGTTTVTKLNFPLTNEGVGSFEISSDSSQVVYTVGEGDFLVFSELYVVPIDGSSVSTKLNGQLAQNGSVQSFKINENGSRVVYAAEQDTTGVIELYSVPIDGNTPPNKLNGVLVNGGNVESFLISNNNNWVVYDADQDTDGMIELYATEEPHGEPYLQYLPIIVTNE